MEDHGFHVLLEGARVGPYNRRTIVGMRIKETLTSDHVVVAPDGSQLTVAELIGKRPAERFSATKSGVFSVVRATYSAAVIDVDRGTIPFPRFRGEVEARVQSDVLRLAGRFRKGFGTKEGRIKIPLADVVHTRVKGSVLEMWLRDKGSRKPQRVELEMFTHDVAKEMVSWFPNASPMPGPAVASPRARSSQLGMWIAIGAIALVFVLVLVVMLWPRVR